VHSGRAGRRRAFERITGELAPYYTVVTYDPRGLSRSPLTGPFDDERAIEINADDAYRLISAVTDSKAYVLASSGGAVISLEVAKRHPERIATLVAHEIPCAAVMPDPTRACEEVTDITDTYKMAGLGAAFSEVHGSDAHPGRPAAVTAG
jgi:pimeloyl-ACP methyl ester carboxylesterase